MPAAAGGQTPSTVSASSAAGLGGFLVGENGHSLYIFMPDEPGLSNCSGMCADFWPPLTVADGVDPSAGPGAPGTLGVAVREDGSRQVTYNDQPLYFFANDSAPGQANGQGVNDIWFVAALEGVTEGPIVKPTESAELGAFLTDADGLTLYIFAPDPPNESTCSGMCADFWPPLTVGEGVTPAAGADIPGGLGVIVRDDGTRQVTYRGRPLYHFANDGAPGDTNGQGVSDIWWVAAVSGAQQTAPTAAAAPPAPPAPPAAGNAGFAAGGDAASAIAVLLLGLVAVGLPAGARALTSRRVR